jgi:hypothetical protein
MHNFKFNKLKPIYRYIIQNLLKNTVLLLMVVIVIQNHCNGEYPKEVITTFDYNFPTEYYWLRRRRPVVRGGLGCWCGGGN